MISQLTDALRFLKNTYSSEKRLQEDRNYSKIVSQKEFDEFYSIVNQIIDEDGLNEINALEFIAIEQKEYQVHENISEYLFGMQKVALTLENQSAEEIATNE